MAADALPSKKEMKAHIREILAASDLSELSSKSVRKEIEARTGVSLKPYKSDVDALLMREVERMRSAEDGSAREQKREECEPAAAKVAVAQKEKRPKSESAAAKENGGKKAQRPPADSAGDEAELVRLRGLIKSAGLTQQLQRIKNLRDMSTGAQVERLRGVVQKAFGTDSPSARQIELAHLRGLIRRAGLSAQLLRLKGLREMEEGTQAERLRGVLRDALGTASPSSAQIAEFVAQRELDQDLQGIDKDNIVGGRRKRGRAGDDDDAPSAEMLAAARAVADEAGA